MPAGNGRNSGRRESMYHEHMIPQVEGFTLVGRTGPFFYLRDESDGTVGEYRIDDSGMLEWLRDVVDW
jgi:hypothetical protein